jgi:DNA primase small subunit
LSKKKNEGLSHPLHPMLVRAYEILEPMFVESVLPASGHGILDSPDHWEPLLDSLPDAARDLVGEKMRNKWATDPTTPAEKWEELKQHLNACFGNSNDVKVKRTKNVSNAERERIENWPAEVVFKYTYPRLDINVSKMQNHLLKSPFCVHPKTGRVCVPIQVDEVDDFDPFAVPTLPQLMKELDEHASEDSTRNPDWHKTSLKGYFEPFQKEFLEPMLKDLRRKAREKAEEQAAVAGDF